MQQFISGLDAIHDMKPFRPLFGKSLEERKKLQQFELQYPPQLHPVVRIHPVSGRKVLFVNPQFTHRASRTWRSAKAARCSTRCSTRRWSRNISSAITGQPHTIAMWDNRSTQHYAVHDYYPQRRYMERVTIKGGPVTGVERADPASMRRAKYVAPKGVDTHGGHKPH